MDTRIIRGAAVAAGLAATARAGLRAAAARDDRGFMRIDPSRDTFHEVGSLRLRLPATWQRTDGIAAYWAADLARVRELLPSPLLHPVLADRHHGVVGIFAFRHFESAARRPDGSTMPLPPYAEAGAYIAVTRRPMPPVVPLVLQWAADRPVGGYVVHLPVTARFHRDGGRSIWGLPKFLADAEFSEDGTSRALHLSEGGRTIMDFRVQVGGDARLSRAPSVMYSVLHGQLLEVVCPSRAVSQRSVRPEAELRLGSHPVAADLADLGLERLLAGGILHQQRFMMPAGRELGPARQDHRYEGSDAEFGTFTTRHADGTLTDHYAPVLEDAPPSSPAGRAAAGAT